MRPGDAVLRQPYTAGSGILKTTPLAEVLLDLEVTPTQVTIFDRFTFGQLGQLSTTYAIGSTGVDAINLGSVLSGSDRNYGIGDLLLLGYADDDSDITLFQSPAFTAFALSGQSNPIEVGATISGSSRTFTWSTSNSANVAASSISIADTTGGTTLASRLANSGSDTLSFTDLTKTSPASQVWTISADDTQGNLFSKTFTVNWLWRVYAGTNTSPDLTANQIKALSDSSNLQSGFAGSYNLSAGGYKFFCYPDSLSSVSSFRDGNGFPISMATSADDSSYSNVANGWSYALVTVINAQAVSTSYRVYRSQYQLGGSLTMVVT